MPRRREAAVEEVADARQDVREAFGAIAPEAWPIVLQSDFEDVIAAMTGWLLAEDEQRIEKRRTLTEALARLGASAQEARNALEQHDQEGGSP